jgi:hypothetical protein
MSGCATTGKPVASSTSWKLCLAIMRNICRDFFDPLIHDQDISLLLTIFIDQGGIFD